jgi:hypothetical protein
MDQIIRGKACSLFGLWNLEHPAGALDLCSVLNISGFDSLCIIQDDELEWKIEVTQMASIYGNAYLTLAAASTEDSSQGCIPRPLVPSIQFEVESSVEAGAGKEKTLLNAHARVFERGYLGDDFVGSCTLGKPG